jgi:ectoine hydroxylase-related dioxygenase (phytanoyl-CoA dioxygenase family)
MDVLAPAEVAQVLAALDRLQQAPAAVRTSLLAHKSHLVSRVLHDLLRHPNILRHVQPLLGSDVLAWGSDFFIKDADSPNFVSWHQDATYWGLIPDDVVTAWIALIPSTVLSGCLQVIPGTHRLALMPHRPTFAPHNMLSRGQTIESGLKQEQAADIVLAPGQMSLHHVKIAHASGPNRSVERRVGFAIRSIGAHVRQEGRNTDTATLVSGANRSGNFILEPAPKGELVPEDIAFHQASWAAEQYAIEVTKQR